MFDVTVEPGAPGGEVGGGGVEEGDGQRGGHAGEGAAAGVDRARRVATLAQAREMCGQDMGGQAGPRPVHYLHNGCHRLTGSLTPGSHR